MQALAHDISWWLQAVAKTFEGHEALFLELTHRVLTQDHQDRVDTSPLVGLADINHPVSYVTEALLRWWYRRSLEDGQGLPEEIKPMFTELCNPQIDRYRHGRMLLAAHVVTLFRVDENWAKQHLLPLFDWQRSETEARTAWKGFLWSPRLYHPLMQTLKPAFLESAHHYAALGEQGRQYAALLTFAALDPTDTFSTAELATATRLLPLDGLHDAAQTLVRALEGAGEQRANYWTNRIAPYLRAIWPKVKDRVSPAIADSLGLLCVAAQDSFPEALTLLRAWLQLQPPAHPDYLVHRLHEADLCSDHPKQALDFLSLVLKDQPQWPISDLKTCLDKIKMASPELETDQRFERLTTYLRRLE